MATVIGRQRKWIGQIYERRLPPWREEWRVKRTRGRPRRMLLDLLVTDGYRKLKEEALHREEWRHWTLEPSPKAENLNKSSVAIDSKANILPLPVLW